MGYAGYAPAKLPTELNDVQRALKGIASQASLEVIGKLVYNAACMPTEAKYKSVKASNAKISSAILQTPGALPAMKALGWELEDEMLVCKRAQSMAQFRDVEAAKAALRKELRKEEVAKLRTAEVRIAA